MTAWEGDSMGMVTEACAMGRAGGLSTPPLMLAQAGQGQKICECGDLQELRRRLRSAWKGRRWRGHKPQEALT